MTNKFFHISVAVVLVVLLFLLSDSLTLFMPEGAQMTALLLSSALILVWAGFVMYENSEDEREVVHKMHAGRIAYLSGLGILTAALIVEGLDHKIDPWILLALGVMVVSKLIARFYLERNQ